jgi:hypothetical protein
MIKENYSAIPVSKHKKRKHLNWYLYIAFIALTLTSCNLQEKEVTIISDDGAWCWFSDPRAIYVHGENKGVLTGWVTEDGSLEAALINKKGEIVKQYIANKLDKDDHANPSFVELKDNKYMVFYTKHFDEFIRYHVKSPNENSLFENSILFDPFDENELKKFPLKRTTYANPFYLKKEEKLFCFGRWTGFKPNMMVSEDNGQTFSKSKVIITNYPFDPQNRPYAKYYSNGNSKIHIVFTDGHPRVEPLNSVYYACYHDGAFWRIDDTKICDVGSLPFTPKDASLIYKADSINGKSWVFDVATDENDFPVVLYAKYPDDMNHKYFHAKYNGEKWVETKICNSGNWFPQTPEGEIEREPNYSGGMTINLLNTQEIYVSEKVNGVFEIVQYNLSKDGKVSKRVPITQNSKLDNVRPFFPRNMRPDDKPVLLWMKNERYIHYTNYKSSIYYYNL